ncbi:MAG: DUF1361 domain-containing protein [Abitibacteriaceae bacterium]|nr:DUF1361 domain-containing protein [Abditibacteriaceae bacterium]
MNLSGFLYHTLWNLGLAVIPVALGYALGALGRRAIAGHNPLLWIGVVVVGFLWLAFVPNTCYLLTEWRHLLQLVERNHLYTRGESDPQYLFAIGLFAFFYFCYSGCGVLALTLSIRPVERMLRVWRLPFPLVAPFLFLLLSVGVYLGLILRYNSWDLWTHPKMVGTTLVGIPFRPVLSFSIFVFALVLWGLYEALDIWVDGVKERLSRFKVKG